MRVYNRDKTEYKTKYKHAYTHTNISSIYIHNIIINIKNNKSIQMMTYKSFSNLLYK